MTRRSYRLCTFLLASSVLNASPAVAQSTAPQDVHFGKWGIDLSTRDTSVKPGDDFQRYASGHWMDTNDIPADQPSNTVGYDAYLRNQARLKTIFDAVVALIGEHGPDAAVVEESYVGADARTALSVGQARGAILVACAAAGVGCAELPPARVKQSICGYGRADKAQVQRMVRAILRLDELPTPDHAADALAVAITFALAPPLERAAR